MLGETLDSTQNPRVLLELWGALEGGGLLRGGDTARSWQCALGSERESRQRVQVGQDMQAQGHDTCGERLAVRRGWRGRPGPGHEEPTC